MGVSDFFGKMTGQGSSLDTVRSGQGGRLNSTQKRDRLEMLADFEEAGLGWFWATDTQGHLTYLSQNAAEKLGRSLDDLMGVSVTSLFLNDADAGEARDERPLSFLINSRSRISGKVVRVKAESETWWSITAKPKMESKGEFAGYRGSAKDITAAIKQERDAALLEKFDPLTGVANRHHISDQLRVRLASYKAAKRSCALMVLDLDRFKLVNDSLGQDSGDELLRQLAERLQQIVGQRGEIGRIGGDEFLIILPDQDDRGDLGDFAGRIIQMLSQPYSVDGRRASVGVSIGTAIAPYDGIEPAELTKAADLAVEAAKGSGRGQYRFYSSDLTDNAKKRRQIEEDLREAIQNGDLELFYQPIVRASDNKLSGFEALMHWTHPERGPISPELFVSIAEESDMVVDLGKWALKQACQDATKWPDDVTISVNVSAHQVVEEDFPTTVSNALASSGLDPHRLELELTESVLADTEAVQRLVSRLRKLGVKLSLDDFGTGYSSLSYLSQVKFNKIKIDKSFVNGSTEADSSNSAIITAIVSLGKALSMDVTAEGVESLDELELVTERGATLIQGYLFSRPISQAGVLEKLNSGDLHYEPQGPGKHRSDRRTVYRRIGVIHEDHRYDVVMRNLSKSGALIEGLLEVPVGTELVVDLGAGQLAVATVRRSDEATQGVRFETPLISDGADGLMTRHRVSPYALAAAGMPLAALPPGNYPMPEVPSDQRRPAAFMQIDTSHHTII